MNWTKTKTDNLKAWEAFEEWCAIEFEDDIYIDKAGQLCFGGTDNLFLDRMLFDFFDAKGIYVGIEVGYIAARTMFPTHFTYILRSGSYATTQHFDSRGEAESAAFTKAFSILESQLKGQA